MELNCHKCEFHVKHSRWPSGTCRAVLDDNGQPYHAGLCQIHGRCPKIKEKQKEVKLFHIVSFILIISFLIKMIQIFF